MNNLPYKIKKYLEKHSVDLGKLFAANNSSYEHVVVVPAIGEFENIKNLLSSLIEANDNELIEKTLVLFVINNLASTSRNVKENNYETIELLKRIIFNKTQDQFENSIVAGKLNLAVIDCSTGGNELPEKDGGVGLARKIGMDEALKFFDYEDERKRIVTALDADCLVGKGYFSAIINSFNKYNYSAAYVRFEHRLPEEEENLKAIINYEIFLRYYLLGLKYAGSQYAIHTIGSTMICDAESYVKIGGMNKRKAAEDFYFMEKLSKIVEIKEIAETTIYPSSRGSWRVPFGTGQRVNRFLSRVTDEYRLYDPESFVILKEWLRLFDDAGLETSTDEILDAANKISPALYDFLQSSGFEKSWKGIKENSKKIEQLNKQKKFWFDGFKTLKLIHHLRDNGMPPVFTYSAINRLFDLYGLSLSQKYEGEDVPPINVQKAYLFKLREIA